MTVEEEMEQGAGSKGENSSPLHPAPRPPASFDCSLFPVPCSLSMSESENKCYKILRAVINAQHNTGQYFAGGN